jgi:hypothetical protein
VKTQTARGRTGRLKSATQAVLRACRDYTSHFSE